jgi:hypothetical protein
VVEAAEAGTDHGNREHPALPVGIVATAPIVLATTAAAVKARE